MKKTLLALALISASAAQAYTIDIQFSGILTTSTDKYGNVLGGTYANAGVGSVVSGTVRFTPTGMPTEYGGTLGNLGEHNGSTYFDLDLEGGGSYKDPSWNPMQIMFTVGGSTYNINQNFGFYDSAFATDAQRTSTEGDADQLFLSSRNQGHYQISPTNADGTYDYVALQRIFRLGLFDQTGQLLDTPDWTKPIDWVAGRDAGYGTGSFSFLQQLWEDGSSHLYTGTLISEIVNAGGGFVLTSFKSTQVPEPSSLALLCGGVAAMLFSRRRAASKT